MKFLTYLALLGGAAAVKLAVNHPRSMVSLRDDSLTEDQMKDMKAEAIKLCKEAGLSKDECKKAVEDDVKLAEDALKPKKALAQLSNLIQITKADWPELTEEQWQEIEDWVKSELANGGTITKKEAHDALADFADRHGFTITQAMWDEAEAAFDYVDANGDGEITWPELKKVLDQHEPKKGGKGKAALVQRVMIQLEKGGELTDEQKQEIADWVESELANDGTITKKEAADAVQAFADKHGFEITDEMWAKLEELFDMVDTNGDGEIDGAEAKAAWEAHQGKGGKGKGGKGKKAYVQNEKKGKKPPKPEEEALVQKGKKGKKPAPEEEALIQKGKKGKKPAPEEEALIQKGKKGKKPAPEEEALIQKGKKGKKPAPEEEALVQKGKKGKKPAPEEEALIQKGKKGKKPAPEEEALIQKGKKGKKPAPEEEALIQKGKKGKKPAPEEEALVQRVMIQLRKGGDLTDEQKQEIADWIESELANDGTITKKEAADAVQAFADKHGFEITDEMWAKLEELFDMIDTNGDGEIDGAEAKAAWEAHQGKKGKGKGGKGKKALVQRVMIQLQKGGPELTDEQKQEIADWVESELANDGTITKQEAADAVQAFADKHGFEITEEMWEKLEELFDMVDTNGDGEIDGAEAQAAWEAHEGKKGKGKGKGGKGKKALVQRVMIQLRKGGELTDEQKQEIADWVESELANDGTITKEEAHGAVKAFAKKHGFKITKEMWAKLEELFDMIDTNGDGEIDGAEAAAAWKAHQEGK